MSVKSEGIIGYDSCLSRWITIQSFSGFFLNCRKAFAWFCSYELLSTEFHLSLLMHRKWNSFSWVFTAYFSRVFLYTERVSKTVALTKKKKERETNFAFFETTVCHHNCLCDMSGHENDHVIVFTPGSFSLRAVSEFMPNQAVQMTSFDQGCQEWSEEIGR